MSWQQDNTIWNIAILMCGGAKATGYHDDYYPEFFPYLDECPRWADSSYTSQKELDRKRGEALRDFN